MKKTATEIAQQVLEKLSEGEILPEDIPEDLRGKFTSPKNTALKTIGATGGGILGGIFGGAAGAGLGSAIRSFPGYEPTTVVGKTLSRAIRNPVGRGIATALPYLGLGTGVVTGARKGYQLLNIGPTLTEEDIQRILDAYEQRVS